MQKIMNEDARWNDDFQRKVEKDYNDLHDLQMDAIAKQKAAADEVTSPHFRYRPELHRMRDGRWMALIGDTDHLEFAIYGIGTSAQQALEEFDSVFERESQQVLPAMRRNQRVRPRGGFNSSTIPKPRTNTRKK